MARSDKVLDRLLSATADRSFRFVELSDLLQRLGFDLRVSGSHHIYSRPGLVEIINLQPQRDGTAKPYQVRQIRNLVLEYGLGGTDD